MQAGRAMRDGAFHLGGDESAEGVDPRREFFPAGQGAGAIHELVPAGTLVHQFVAEAEKSLDRAAALRV
jgi:enoyl-[acyl-carrier protein] reductase II